MYTGREARQNADVGSRSSAMSWFARTLSITAESEPAVILDTNNNRQRILILTKPFITMLLYESVIPKMRISAAHAVNFVALPGRKLLLGVQAPPPFEQALPPQDFVDAENASSKTMRGIEDGGVCIGDLLRER